VWYKNVGTISFFRFVTIHAFVGQTDRQADRKALQYRALHYMQSHGKKVSPVIMADTSDSADGS